MACVITETTDGWVVKMDTNELGPFKVIEEVADCLKQNGVRHLDQISDRCLSRPLERALLKNGIM